jgi:GAF domain-containing protein
MMTKTLDPGGFPGDATDPLVRAVEAVANGLASVDLVAFDALERIGRSVHSKGGDLESTLEAVVRTTVETVHGTRDAGLNLFVHGKFMPQVVFGAAPPELDRLQQQLGDGPCIAASRDQLVVHLRDVSADARWPEFAVRADLLGVRSMLCVPLWIDDSRLGSLSLYADVPDAFGEHEARVAALLATHAALVIADARRVENLRVALETRDVIGQAKGILMERHRVTSEQAFQLLVAASQHANKKLSEIAEEFTSTGSLP